MIVSKCHHNKCGVIRRSTTAFIKRKTILKPLKLELRQQKYYEEECKNIVGVNHIVRIIYQDMKR